MFALIKKEIRVHFSSPIFPVAAALFLFLTGFAFTAHMTQASPQRLPEASIRGMIYFMSVILLFISPLLAMRSFAEERKSGTIELLKTSPLSDLQIILAKYLGLLFLLALLLLLTFEFPILIGIVGDQDLWALFLSYSGLFLLGATFIAIGIFASVLTHSQMLAAILTFITAITLWFLGEIGGEIGEKISIIEHMDSFSLGVLDITDCAYYLLMNFLFLFDTSLFGGRTVEVDQLEKRRRIKYGTNAMALTLLVILTTVLLYGILEDKNWRWDLTENKQFSLSDQTEKVLGRLKDEVEITAFFRGGADLDEVFTRRKVDDILKEYRSRSKKITYRMLNPELEIEEAIAYHISTDGTIVFESKKGRKEVYHSQLFDYSDIGERPLPQFVGESLFTNALLKVTQEGQKMICLLSGHGERSPEDSSPTGFKMARTYLEKNNYEIQDLSLITTPEIPASCDILMINAPEKGIPPVEDRLIRDWLKTKGRLLLLWEPLIPSMLSETLDLLKVDVHRDLVIDPQRHFLLGPHYPAPSLSDHEITKDLQEMTPILSSASSLSYRGDDNEGIPLMTTSAEAWGEADLKGEEASFHAGRDRKGPLTLGLAITRPPDADVDSKTPLAVVVGDADFASDGLIQAPGNLDLFLNMVAWLAGEKDQIAIRPKTTEFRGITLTPGRASFIAYFTQLVYPLIVLSVGGIYWYRRRNA